METVLLQCDNCGEEQDSLNRGLCDTCFDEHVECAECNDLTHQDNTIYIENMDITVCETCYEQHYVTCYCCDEILHVDNSTHANGNYYCKPCADEIFYSCDRCGDLERRESFSEVEGETWCEHCTERYASWCEECNEYHTDACEHEQGLLPYNYKPKPKFFRVNERKSLCFGLEIEVEGEKPEIESEWFYCKSDGSLDSGFELVTHPLSYRWIRTHKNEFQKLLIKLAKNGCRSYNTETCGIHIHVSKQYLTTLQIAKIVRFFSNNTQQILTLSQRAKVNLDRWASLSTQNDEVLKYAKNGNGSRYVAVNLQNYYTVEFRIFRGTLNPSSFFKNIEFIDSIIEFTSITGYLKAAHWSQYANFLKSLNKNKYRNLNKFLIKKGLM